MSALRKLQEEITAGILRDMDATLLPVQQKERLKVYKNNTALTLRDLLKDVFPVTTLLLGTEFMHHVAHGFIGISPPSSGDMNAYGGGFPDFLAHLPSLNKHAYIPDVARLEWLARRSYLSPRLAPMTMEDLAAEKDPVAMQLRIQPHLFLLRSGWPVDKVWSAVTEQGENLKGFDLKAQETFVAIFRDTRKIAVWSLTEGGYKFIEHLQSAPLFAAAAETALSAENEFPLDQLLGTLIQQDLLVKGDLP